MKGAKLQRLYWLDIAALSKHILMPDQELVCTKHFTSRVGSPPSKVKRQGTYLEALYTLPGVQIFYGKFQNNPRTCRNCGKVDYVPNEKMTDVNIAVELMSDAFKNVFDTAVLVSGDSDLVGPVGAVVSGFKDKRLVCAFPPERWSNQLNSVASAAFSIGKANLAKSQLPDQITKPDGFTLKRPIEWE